MCLCGAAWYDYELTQYQKERQETELERIFEERSASTQQVEIGEHLGKQKIIKEPETEWQQTVKKKKGEEYYSKLKEVCLIPEAFSSCFYCERLMWVVVSNSVLDHMFCVTIMVF